MRLTILHEGRISVSEILATAKRPWYTVPNDRDSGISAIILNAEGEHVATVEDMGEAQMIARLVNDARA